jgi:general secretion pathway protein L
MSTLIVTLPLEACSNHTLFNYLLIRDGQQVGKQSSAPAALLPSANSSVEWVALVPAQKLSWHQVQLPKGTLGRRFLQKGNPPRLRAVLEGLLEDRLLSDTAELHFAIEPQPQMDAPIWVAVCDRAWLHSALGVLEQAGRPVRRIVPEFAPESWPETLYVMGEPNDAHLVHTQKGVTVWPLSRATVALLNWPENHRIVAEPVAAALAESLFNRPIELQQASQQALQAALSQWDLAQFDLLNSSRTRIGRRLAESVRRFFKAPHWRAARVSLLALLLINLAGLNAWAWKEQSLITAKQLAIRNVLTQTFPKVPVVVDAPVQMRREVQALQQASGTASGQDLETMLSTLAGAAPDIGSPETIDFAAGELRLKGLKIKPDDITVMAFNLQRRGYSALVEGNTLLVKQAVSP